MATIHTRSSRGVSHENGRFDPEPQGHPLDQRSRLRRSLTKWDATLEAQRVNEQDYVAQFERATPGYTFLNASIGYKFRAGPTYNYLYVKGTNVTNEEARDHLSFLKEVLPLAAASPSAFARRFDFGDVT
jgi:iron complex outermembrane receptor protein